MTTWTHATIIRTQGCAVAKKVRAGASKKKKAIPMYQELFENYSAEKLNKFEDLKDSEKKCIYKMP